MNYSRVSSHFLAGVKPSVMVFVLTVGGHSLEENGSTSNQTEAMLRDAERVGDRAADVAHSLHLDV